MDCYWDHPSWSLLLQYVDREVCILNYVGSDILESDCQAITNTVNCRGVVGKGLALQFKQKYPDMFLAYKEACKKGYVQIGLVWMWPLPENRCIVNVPTKDDWRRPSKLEYIEKGLSGLYSTIECWRLKSLALPALGCKNGGLSWKVVKPLIEKFNTWLPEDFRLDVYPPNIYYV